MKKLIVSGLVVCAAICAQATAQWSWWMENKTAKPSVSFGIASKCQSVESLEFSLLYSASPVSGALQGALIGLNNSEADCVLQLAFVNIGKDLGLQFGCLNISKSSSVDLGFCNVADDSKFQLGLLNFNKKGFLPVFPFINFDPNIFKK